MTNSRPPVAQAIACTSCFKPVAVNEVLVYTDFAGCEGPAVDPFHLKCYLEGACLELHTNKPLVDFVVEQATSIIRDYYNNPR